MKGTMKCPKGQFPCPKESANYLCSNLSFHPFSIFSFITSLCVLHVPLWHPVYLSRFLFLCVFLCERPCHVCSVVLPRVSHYVFCAGSQKSAVCWTWSHTPCFVITLSHRDISCPFVPILFNCKNITSILTTVLKTFFHFSFRLWRLSRSCVRCKAWTLWWSSTDNIWASCWTGCLPLSAPGPVSLHRGSSCRP